MFEWYWLIVIASMFGVAGYVVGRDRGYIMGFKDGQNFEEYPDK